MDLLFLLAAAAPAALVMALTEGNDLVQTLWVRYEGEDGVRAAEKDLESYADLADEEMKRVEEATERAADSTSQLNEETGTLADQQSGLTGALGGTADVLQKLLMIGTIVGLYKKLSAASADAADDLDASTRAAQQFARIQREMGAGWSVLRGRQAQFSPDLADASLGEKMRSAYRGAYREADEATQSFLQRLGTRLRSWGAQVGDTLSTVWTAFTNAGRSAVNRFQGLFTEARAADGLLARVGAGAARLGEGLRSLWAQAGTAAGRVGILQTALAGLARIGERLYGVFAQADQWFGWLAPRIAAQGGMVGRLGGAWLRLQGAMGAVAGTVAGVAAAFTTLAATGIGITFATAAYHAIQFQEAMIGVAKTTGLTGEALQSLSEEVNAMSAALGMQQEALAEIAEAAGQLGIRGADNIAAFTRTVAKLAQVSDLTAQEAADAMAGIQGAFDLPAKSAENLASVINYLSNTTRSSSAKIVDAVERAAGTASKLGMAVDEVAALSTAIMDTVSSSQRAGTMLRNILLQIQTNAADVAAQMGITEEAFRTMISEDALGALQEYLRTMAAAPDATIRMTEIFGKENIEGMQALVGGIDTLTGRLAAASDEYERATSINDEFQSSLAIVAAQWRKLTAGIEAWLTGLGTNLIPALQTTLSWLNRWAQSAAEVAEEVKGLQSQQAALAEDRSAFEAYRELAGRTGLTADESERLENALGRLQERYPSLVAQTNAAGEATSLYANAMRDAIGAAEALNLEGQADRIRDLVENWREATAAEEEAQERADAIAAGRWLPPVPSFTQGLQGRTEALSEAGNALETARQRADSFHDALLSVARTRGLEHVEQALVLSGLNAGKAREQVAALRAELERMAEEEKWDTINEAIYQTRPGAASPLETDDEGALSPEDVEALRNALQDYVEATRIAEAATEDWQGALRDLFDAEARIRELNEAIASLGADYVPGGQREGEEKTLRTLLELEKERRDTAKERVEAEEAFVERLRSAIANVERVIPLRVEVEDLPTAADLQEQIREATGGSLPYLKDAEAAARAYSDAMTALENRLAAGAISQEQFAQQSAEATEEYLEHLRSLYTLLEELGVLTPKLEKGFRKLFEEAGDEAGRTGEEVEDLHATLEDVARAGRAVLGLVDTFGDLSDETRRFAEGLLGAVDNMSRLVELKNQADSWANLFSGASAVGAIAPALGAASGIVQAMSGLFSGGPTAAERRQAERLEDLSDQLQENVRAVRENTKALFEAARVGADLSEREVERAEEILVEIEEGETDLDPLVREISDILGIDLSGIVDPITEALEGIQEMSYPAEFQRTAELSAVTGMDFGEQLDDSDIRQIVSGLLTGAFTAAQEAEIMTLLGLEDVDLSALDDLADLPGDLGADLGAFGQSVDGAAEKMRFFTEHGLAEGTEAFQAFADHILGLDLSLDIAGEDLGGAGIREETREGERYEGPEAGRSLRDLLEEAEGLDLETEEGRGRLAEIQRAIAEAIAAGAFDFGALSPEEMDTLLGVMGDFSGAMAEATRATEAAQERLRFMTAQGLVEGTEALRMFAGMLQEVDLGGAGIEGGPTMQALLEEVEGLDLSTEEDRERLTEIRQTIAQAVAEEAFRYGAMTEEEMEGLLDTFMAFEEGRFSAPATEEEGRYTSQVQIESTITEYQANRLLLAQDEQIYLQTQIADAMRRSADLTAEVLTELTGREYRIEWPEPVETLTAPEIETALSDAAPAVPDAPEAPSAPDAPPAPEAPPAPDASKPEVNIDAPNVEVTAPDVDLEVPEIEAPPAPDVSVNTSAPEAPVVSPAIDVTAPDVTLEAPTVDVAAPSVDVSAPVPPAPDVAAPPAPNVDVEALSMPQVIVEAPVVDVTAPEVHLSAPPVPEAPDVAVPDVTAEFNMDAAAGLLDTLTGQVEALAASQHDVVAPVHEENVSITSIEETTRKLSQRQTTYENTFNIYESGDADQTARQIEDVLQRQHLHD